jgi:YHS domain-containing protein
MGKRSEMMLGKMIVVMLLAVGLVCSGYALAADNPDKDKPQTVCPVLGGKIDKNVYTDYQGKRIYFCCSGCIDEFKKNPAKYLKQMEEQGVTPEKAPGAK